MFFLSRCASTYKDLLQGAIYLSLSFAAYKGKLLLFAHWELTIGTPALPSRSHALTLNGRPVSINRNIRLSGGIRQAEQSRADRCRWRSWQPWCTYLREWDKTLWSECKRVAGYSHFNLEGVGVIASRSPNPPHHTPLRLSPPHTCCLCCCSVTELVPECRKWSRKERVCGEAAWTH